MATDPTASLVDRFAIRRTLRAYATGVDRRDWALFRGCFTDTVHIDLESFSGAPPADMSADDWCRGVASGLSGFDETQHVVANHLIELVADAARATSDVQATHRLGDETVRLGGYYETRLIREDDAWCIQSHALHVTWREGDPALFERARRA